MDWEECCDESGVEFGGVIANGVSGWLRLTMSKSEKRDDGRAALKDSVSRNVEW